MADVKISQLTAATAVTADDVFPGNDGSTTKQYPAPVMAQDAYLNHGNTGSTETIDLASGTLHRIVLDSATVTLTFSGAVSGSGCSFTLIVVQDGTGSRLVTWPASVDWPSATAPTLSTTAAYVDVLTFFTVDGGTTWLGALVGTHFA